MPQLIGGMTVETGSQGKGVSARADGLHEGHCQVDLEPTGSFCCTRDRCTVRCHQGGIGPRDNPHQSLVPEWREGGNQCLEHRESPSYAKGSYADWVSEGSYSSDPDRNVREGK